MNVSEAGLQCYSTEEKRQEWNGKGKYSHYIRKEIYSALIKLGHSFPNY